MAVEVRVLEPGEEARLEEFLARHPDTSMFLRSNLAKTGLVDRGETFQGTYVAAIEEGAIVGVAASYWQGNVIVCAPRHTGELARLAAEKADRPVAGLLGPWDQVGAARTFLGMDARATTISSCDVLYSLAIDELVTPALLGRHGALVRRPHATELALLAAWRKRYRIETLNEPDTAELAERSRRDIETLFDDDSFVLEVDGRPVAFSAFNARIPDTVQIGGVWTPPEWRGRGYGRSVVAGSLVHARKQGVTRSILFTDVDNRPARAAYEGIGYRAVGDYGLVLFA